MNRQALVPLGLCGVAVAVAALVGSLSAVDAADSYADLDQPAWAPPSWLFGPVWTVLYIGIAVVGWRLWMDAGWSTDMKLWSVQLGFNALWTPLFFLWELRALALAWIIVLDVLVALLIWRTRGHWVSYVLMPYMAWVAFATALNASIWWMN